jgi:hypothetical protein
MTEPVPYQDPAGQDVPAGLLTLSEAACHLDQPVEDIFRGVMTGRLPAVWIGPWPYLNPATVQQ